jgi:hypothetical protein
VTGWDASFFWRAGKRPSLMLVSAVRRGSNIAEKMVASNLTDGEAYRMEWPAWLRAATADSDLMPGLHQRGCIPPGDICMAQDRDLHLSSHFAGDRRGRCLAEFLNEDAR